MEKKFPILTFSIGSKARTAGAVGRPAVVTSVPTQVGVHTPDAGAVVEAQQAAQAVSTQPTPEINSDPKTALTEVATKTLKAAIAAQIIGSAEASSQLKTYTTLLNQATNTSVQDILYAVWGADVVGLHDVILKINDRMDQPLPVWDFCRRLAPPSTFYDKREKIESFCRHAGAVVLDVGGERDYITLGVQNPFMFPVFQAVVAAEFSDHATGGTPLINGAIIPPADIEVVLATHFR